MSFKDNAKPTDENGANSTPLRAPATAFGQALPRTAPIADARDSKQRRNKALFNVPDWRPEEEIILEAASQDPKIKLPQRLRPGEPKVIEGRIPNRDALQTVTPEESVPPPGPVAGSPTEKTTHREPQTPQTALKPKPTGKPLLNSSEESPTRGQKTPPLAPPVPLLPTNQVEIAARIIGNLAALMIPTLCILLLSGWGPDEIAIIFDDFWPYLGLASFITIVLVILDQIAAALAGVFRLSKPLAWIMEFVFSALGAGVCLYFFTHSGLGAFLLALVMSVLTSLFSMIVAKLF